MLRCTYFGKVNNDLSGDVNAMPNRCTGLTLSYSFFE